MKYASFFTIKGESSNIICMYCLSQFVYKYKFNSKKNKSMVRLWLRNIDDNSSRHPYLFKAKSLKLFNQVLILLMNATLGSTRTHFISWYCRYYKKEINVLQLQLSQDTKSCFLGWKKQSTFWFRFWATNQSFCVSKKLVNCIISYKDYVCVIFQFHCSAIP